MTPRQAELYVQLQERAGISQKQLDDLAELTDADLNLALKTYAEDDWVKSPDVFADVLSILSEIAALANPVTAIAAGAVGLVGVISAIKGLAG